MGSCFICGSTWGKGEFHVVVGEETKEQLDVSLRGIEVVVVS